MTITFYDKSEAQEYAKQKTKEGYQARISSKGESWAVEVREASEKEPWQMTRQEYTKTLAAKEREQYAAALPGTELTRHISRARNDFQRWHRNIVSDAIKRGELVPPKVLKDYLELK